MTADADDHWHRALLLFEQRRYDLAIAELHEIFAADPEHFGALVLFVQALSAKGDHPAALREARRLVSTHPDDAHAHATLADCLLANGRHDAAIEAIQEALAREPNEPDHHGTLARAHLLRERWNRALAAALRGLEIDPEHHECQALRVRALAHEGEFDAARAAAAEELARHPDSGDAHALAGVVELLAGRPDAAMLHYLEALRIDPSLRHARLDLLEALRARNPWFRAMGAVARVMEKSSGPIGVLATAAWLLPRYGPKNPAIAGFFTAIQSLLALGFLCLVSARPIANSTLLLHRFGRHGLRRGVALASVVVSLVAAAGVVFWTLARADGADGLALGWPFWIAFVVAVLGTIAIVKTDDG